MNSNNCKKQAKDALTVLEDTVYQTVLNYNCVHRSLTEDFCRELGLTEDGDTEIVRHILNKLKAKGLVKNLTAYDIVNENAWLPTKEK